MQTQFSKISSRAIVGEISRISNRIAKIILEEITKEMPKSVGEAIKKKCR